ncbi:MAG: hypothetical protein SF187_28920 [Deltaproteobacteria bacterium]|nr:hypothetical protein [Deltaproteobacteria bacterium]
MVQIVPSPPVMATGDVYLARVGAAAPATNQPAAFMFSGPVVDLSSDVRLAASAPPAPIAPDSVDRYVAPAGPTSAEVTMAPAASAPLDSSTERQFGARGTPKNKR